MWTEGEGVAGVLEGESPFFYYYQSHYLRPPVASRGKNVRAPLGGHSCPSRWGAGCVAVVIASENEQVGGLLSSLTGIQSIGGSP